MDQDNKGSTPAPLETDSGRQKDDNLDDLGHKTDGSEQDQPVDGGHDHSGKRDKPAAK